MNLPKVDLSQVTLESADKCANCIYSKKVIQAGSVLSQLTCARFPPVPGLMGSQQGVAIMAMNVPINENGWCGEFKSKLNS